MPSAREEIIGMTRDLATQETNLVKSGPVDLSFCDARLQP